jgi:predicted phage terminase large subunit-like protein
MWKTLWPYSDRPADPDEDVSENGLYRRWDGETLAEVRNGLSPAMWSRIYQQEQVAEDNVFKAELLSGSTQMRHPGIIPDDHQIGRQRGMNGLRIIAGLDPASVGHTAAVVIGLDTETGKRYVIDIHNQASMTPDAMRDLIKGWTVKYGIQEWRIERNAFQAFLTRDTEIIQFLASRGSTLSEHMTGNNKHDPNFGVMAMSSLFEAGLILLPNSSSESVKAMIDQLVVWQPNPPRGTKTDIVMALWFAELRCLELVQRFNKFTHYRNTPFTTRSDRSTRFTMSAAEYEDMSANGTLPRSWWAK